MSTIQLFDEDAYLEKFGAMVVACQPAENGQFRVILNQTAFFPEQGGQTSDVGTLGGAKVSHVAMEEGEIVHYCDASFRIEEMITGRIDWEHRFNNMQQHTGEHIFTGIAHNKFGAENVGFHLSDNVVTLDLDIELTPAQVQEVETAANELIAESQNVWAWYPTAEELKEISYRSKKEIEGAIRLVRIGGVDVCACCAPHVKKTSEVGILKVISFERYKGGIRVYILCGLRALEDYRRRMGILTDATRLFSCSEGDLCSNVTKLMEESRGLRLEVSKLRQQLLQSEVDKLPKDVEMALLFTEGVDAKSMREVVNSMMETRSGICGIFSGNDESGYNYILASRDKDMQIVLGVLREKMSCKGGGSKAMIQGQIFNTKEEIGKVLDGSNF